MSSVQSLALVGCILLLHGGSTRAAEPGPTLHAVRAPGPDGRITFACGTSEPCRPQAGPGPADRAVRPFEGTLGRPCGYRWRATPEGTRKVRVCF